MQGSSVTLCHPFGVWQHEERVSLTEPLKCLRDESWQCGWRVCEQGGWNLAPSKENTKQLWPYLLSLLELSAEIQYRALDRCIEASFHTDLPQQRRSQLPSHLCSFNPIDFSGAVGEEGEEEGTAGSAGHSSGHQLGSTSSSSLHQPQETTGEIWDPSILCKPQDQCTGMGSSRIKDFALNQVTGKLEHNPLIFWLLLFSLCNTFFQLNCFAPS